MSRHTVSIETVYAEAMLELPAGIYIRGARVFNGDLILVVDSDERLGEHHVRALYGNSDEDETKVHFGMFERIED